MFPKGPRFEPLKVPDVPGPNAYNIPQESVLDNYKRGAFLEKTDRFSKDKPSLYTGPVHKATESVANPNRVVSNPSSTERYNLLQKKVDELEKVHLEGKRAHQAEIEKYKQNAAASQKQALEQAERFEKQKKQNAVLEARLQELKKTSSGEQSELKEVRHKLRLLELERDKTSSKQPEINEMKKSLATLEAKRKDEVRDRDRRIAELERQLQTEQKKRESSENRIKDSKRPLEEEVQALKITKQEIETQLIDAQAESRSLKAKLSEIESNVGNREQDLLQQLEQHQTLMTSVVRQYGALANQTVQTTVHRQLKHEYSALRIRQLRLERKLANSEGQVVELTHLFRQVKEDNNLLKQLLRDALHEISIRAESDTHSMPHSDDFAEKDMMLTLEQVRHNANTESIQRIQMQADINGSVADFYRLKGQQLCFAASVLAKEQTLSQSLADHRASDLASTLASHEAIAARLELIQKDKVEFDEKLTLAVTEANDLRTTSAILEAKLAESQQELRDAAAQHANASKKDKDTIQRLTTTIQKSRVAEDALRSEIELLTQELADAERYREAYESLNGEVSRLLIRNEIAEGEAERISKFNAEILGHNNPAQRIMYVDRIRQELAQAKHTIGLLTNEQENIAQQNEALQHELDMYKSVQVPLDSKPRTHITRVGRAPLVSLAASMNASTQRPRSASAKAMYSHAPVKPVLEVINDGDMTTDELM